jgi:DNA-binding response OmpR family regulator
VVITAYGSVPSALRALELGATDFLAKPVEPAVLRRTVVQVLLGRPEGEGQPDRPAAISLGNAARRFAETLALAWRAWERGQVELTEYLLQQALELDPDSAEANTLRGDLQERVGEPHAAYQSYRRALSRDRHHDRARDGLRRYCEWFGLDYKSKAINPGAE